MMQELDDFADAPAQNGLTDDELRALAYFAVGVGSEGSVGGRDVSNKLSFAGTIWNGVMDPVGNSGFSIGTLQTDLGQHPEAAASLVNAYQVWANVSNPDWVLTDAQRIQTTADLARNGRVIEAQNGRALDPDIKSRLDAFLESGDGVTFVHNRDVAQVDILMRADGAIDQLKSTALYQNSTQHDQAKLATILMKLENQGGRGYYPRIINGINDGTLSSFEDVKTKVDGFMPNRNDRPDYLESGADHALKGAEVFVKLRNANQDSPLNEAWNSVLANPLVNPARLSQYPVHPNLKAEYTTSKNMFLQPGEAIQFIDSLDRGVSHTSERPGARGTVPPKVGFYAAGAEFVQWNRAGVGYNYSEGGWTEIARNDITRIANADGTIDLNIDHGGRQEHLLRVDPDAPALRRAAEGEQVPVQVAPQVGAHAPRAGYRAGPQEQEDRNPDVLPGPDPLPGRPLSPHVTSGPDPRHPEHPDHAMHQGVRDQVRSLYAEHGLALSDHQLECTTACVMTDARRAGMSKVTTLEFSENYTTGKLDLNGNLIAYQGDPNKAATKYSATETQHAGLTEPEDSYRQFEKATQLRAQAEAQYLARQEQVAQGQSAQTRAL